MGPAVRNPLKGEGEREESIRHGWMSRWRNQSEFGILESIE